MADIRRMKRTTLFKMWLDLVNKLPWSDNPDYKKIRKEMHIIEREMERREDG